MNRDFDLVRFLHPLSFIYHFSRKWINTLSYAWSTSFERSSACVNTIEIWGSRHWKLDWTGARTAPKVGYERVTEKPAWIFVFTWVTHQYVKFTHKLNKVHGALPLVAGRPFFVSSIVLVDGWFCVRGLGSLRECKFMSCFHVGLIALKFSSDPFSRFSITHYRVTSDHGQANKQCAAAQSRAATLKRKKHI